MPKKFSVETTNEQLQTFKKAISDGKEKEFVENYIIEHKEVKEITNVNDVYSLLLIKAILKSDSELTFHILSNVNKDNILANIDKSGNSPIYVALMFNDEPVLKVIDNYLKKQKGQLEKAEIPGYMLNGMVNVVSLSTTAETFMNNYIRSVYNEESINRMVEVIGEDNIYDVTY